MTPTTILDQLGRLGVRVEMDADGERLRFHPRSAVTEELLENMKAHKSELLRITGLYACRGHVDPTLWTDDPPVDGRIRTTCSRCGRFIGYRPVGRPPPTIA